MGSADLGDKPYPCRLEDSQWRAASAAERVGCLHKELRVTCTTGRSGNLGERAVAGRCGPAECLPRVRARQRRGLAAVLGHNVREAPGVVERAAAIQAVEFGVGPVQVADDPLGVGSAARTG